MPAEKYDVPAAIDSQLYEKVAAPSTCRPRPTSTSPPTSHAALALTVTTRASAGTSRRARRTQNARSAMRPVAARSRSRSEVMRNPEMTKKASTPTKPECRNALGNRW